MKNILKYFIILVLAFSLFFISSQNVVAINQCACVSGLRDDPGKCNGPNACDSGYLPDYDCPATYLEPGLYSCGDPPSSCICVGCSNLRGEECYSGCCAPLQCSNNHCCGTGESWDGTRCYTPVNPECTASTWYNTGSSCGNCGTQQRWCNSDGTWSNTYQCINEGCSPGSTQSCGNCGTGTQTCSSSCSWGACTGESCSPGSTRSCGNCGTGTQTCSSSCSWGACTGESCAPGSYRCSDSSSSSVKQLCNSQCQWTLSENCNNWDGWACDPVRYKKRWDYKCFDDNGVYCHYISTPLETVDCYTSNYNQCNGDLRQSVTYSCPAGDNDCRSSTTTIQNCNDLDGSGYCNSDGVTRETRDYTCTNSGASCTPTVTSSENCAAKTSTDTDGGNIPNTAGVVTDYTTCSSGSCSSSSLSDTCSGTQLQPEYYASGASYGTQNYNCESNEGEYCSNDRRYRNEWGCSGSPGACTDIADTASGTNTDGDAKDFQCGDS